MTLTTQYDFDTVIKRRHMAGFKWTEYDEDVLPLWVAEMDFQTAPEIIQAVHARVEHGIFGYSGAPYALNEVIAQRMQDRYNWHVNPDDIIYSPGVVTLLNLTTQAIGKAGDGVLMNTPVYGPFLNVPSHRGRFAQTVAMNRVDDDSSTFHYELDLERFEAAITKQSSLYYLCDPHNPAGKIFRRDEVEQLAAICLKHDITIAADHIHGDLLFDDNTDFVPIASLAPEIAQKSVTMFAPSKTFNLAGLVCSAAIVPDADLRENLKHMGWVSGYHVDATAYSAALAAYTEGQPWLDAILAYLKDNRDYAVSYIREHLPMIKVTIPEATYLMWLDCSAIETNGRTMQQFFVDEARVALSSGEFFGEGYEQYVRLNFACPRSILAEALERMKMALDEL